MVSCEHSKQMFGACKGAAKFKMAPLEKPLSCITGNVSLWACGGPV